MTRTEAVLVKGALVRGYEIVRAGWPDYALVRGDEIIFVEVKPRRPKGARPDAMYCLSGKQLRTLKLLERLGLKVRVALDGKMDQLMTVDNFLRYTKHVAIEKRKDGGKHIQMRRVRIEPSIAKEA